ncbi:hypothetical protein D3C71_1646280 [compost metagenome]
MRIEGVRQHKAVEVKVDAFTNSLLTHLFIHGDCFLTAHAVSGREHIIDVVRDTLRRMTV